MEMYDVQTIDYKGRPLFQMAKMISPDSLSNSLQDMACFFYVLRGKGETVDGTGAYALKRNDGLLKSCGNFISSYFKDQDGCDFEALVIYFYPDVIKDIFKQELPDVIAESTKASPVKIFGNDLIEKFIKGMFLYFESAELMDDELARLKIRELIMILLKSNYYSSVVEFFQGMFSRKSQGFRDVVENNLYSNITMDQLAFLTAKSLSSFKREFKREFGETPARYIKNKRLDRAAKELLITDQSVTHVAFDCGFQDLSTFSDSFSKRFGQSPSQYRLAQIRK